MPADNVDYVRRDLQLAFESREGGKIPVPSKCTPEVPREPFELHLLEKRLMRIEVCEERVLYRLTLAMLSCGDAAPCSKRFSAAIPSSITSHLLHPLPARLLKDACVGKPPVVVTLYFRCRNHRFNYTF